MPAQLDDPMVNRSAQVVTTAILFLATFVARAEQTPSSATSHTFPTKQTLAFVGCVKNVLSDKPWAAIQDADTGITYPITNFSLKDYGGKKVSIVVTLQPSPNLAGQLSSIDRSRLVILAGGTAPKIPPSAPAAHVVKLRTLEICPE